MTNRQQTNNRIQQQRLRDRRKEEGWKRVTVWVSPEVANCLQAIDPNLGTAIYEVINKLSDNNHNKLPDNLFEPVVTTDNHVDSVNDFDLSASKQQVKKSGVKYHDNIKLMAWKLRCEGLTRAQITDAIQLEVGEPLPRSFMSHLNRLIKAGQQLAEGD
ncbi:hypothetical protein [Chromatium okenii]|jgi:hypothetical protein|uniref:Uncharacterized protein n=1 Tax=Chromatium okenii TaxID=61644 RepID=A0A2S7XTL9_9GAMM|nr:hypothetical protein [Chromatium okenii]MBV5311116.1 hypothetical protein [Chromatium okenii]PQJ96838.1 hypothetical protein CXB77_05335 [Chromatium okenii]